ncbi:sensor domain-containing diguanylate cyclase [Vibrio maerlii]|uniref:sensor domain-containing diguanylate cyclase n=1 Tax=Vibrio maerlii TaxID=2231648 RepID=UPI0013DE9CCB|nr:sensor domain-containing diguanylate cyclase [Vibrio maerlii]
MIREVEAKADQMIVELHGDRNVAGVLSAKEELKKLLQQDYTLNPIYGDYLEATLAFRQDEYAKAIELFLSIIQQVRDTHFNVVHSYSCVYLATLYAFTEQFYLSQEFFTEAEETLRDDDHNLSLFLNTNLSGIYIELEDYQSSLKHSMKAVSAGEQADNPPVYALALANSGYSLMRTMQADAGLESLNKAEAYSREQGFTSAHAWTLLYRAMTFEVLKRLPEAAQDFKAVYNFTRNNKDVVIELEFYRAYSRFLYETSNYQLAVKFCNQALSSKSVGTQIKIRVALLQVLSDSHHKLNDSLEESRCLRLLADAQQNEIEKNRKNESKYIQRAIGNAKNSFELQQSRKVTEQLDQINSLGQLIASSSDTPDDVLAIYECIQNTVPCSAFSLSIYYRDRDVLEYRYQLDNGEFRPGFEIDCSEISRLGIYCVKNQQTLHLNTCSDQEISNYLDEKYRLADIYVGEDNPAECGGTSVITTPIVFQSNVIGVFSVQKDTVYAYNNLHVKIVEQIANYLAVSFVHNGELLEQQEQHQYRELIYHTDPLTGLHNRHGLSEYLKERFQSPDAPKALTGLMIDIDCMKRYNETYGLIKGDQVLTKVANTLNQSIDGDTQVYRIGGDEFLLLLSQGDESKALRQAERVQAELNDLNIDHPHSLATNRLSATIGIFKADTRSSFEPFVEAMLSSERAMIGAKKKSRNAIYRYAMK